MNKYRVRYKRKPEGKPWEEIIEALYVSRPEGTLQFHGSPGFKEDRPVREISLSEIADWERITADKGKPPLMNYFHM